MQADRVRLAALIVLGCDNPNFQCNLGSDFLHHRHAGGIDSIVVCQDYAVKHRWSPAS
jgi:hypothetical protein